jgi:formylglycine-generating enzyme required for sulfatase activity
VLKALAKSPQERYASAGGLATDLEAWLAGKPTEAAPLRPKRRRLGLALAAFVTVCALVAALVQWRITVNTPPKVIPLERMWNSAGMILVKIPSGSMTIGSPETEAGRSPDEFQRRIVIPAPFFMATTPVTQSQYENVMHVNPSDARWRGPDIPVQAVPWDDAVEFCRRLSQREGRTYRLPSEIEWEYACRAGSDGPFNGVYDPGRLGWYAENSGGNVHAVQGKWPNVWGLYDMHGNVGQWCKDAYLKDPRTDTNAPGAFIVRVVRGGSALSPMSECRAAMRNQAAPVGPFPTIGFRVVCDD